TSSPGAGALPPAAFGAALARLPGMGPRRLAALLAEAAPDEAWRRVRAGRGLDGPGLRRALGTRAGELVARWRAAAAGLEPVGEGVGGGGAAGAGLVPAAEWRRLAGAGVGAADHGGRDYPPALAGDVEPPAVLFRRGDPAVLTGLRVAIVGTRRCSSTGAAVATELGRDLAAAGVAVVSGLASGIDAAAHRGALAAGGAPPIGVVGSGLDTVYPRGQERLWRDVAAAGVLLSEAPLGGAPERWRFPARNRVIAALADVVVVVESHRRGGSLHTVDE